MFGKTTSSALAHGVVPGKHLLQARGSRLDWRTLLKRTFDIERVELQRTPANKKIADELRRLARPLPVAIDHLRRSGVCRARSVLTSVACPRIASLAQVASQSMNGWSLLNRARRSSKGN